MKKIDLHIHTVATVSDCKFTFSLDAFKDYVRDAKLDAVAITNHDMFDGEQFRMIKHQLGVPVFPGIEVNMDMGHILIIADGTDIDDFQRKADMVSEKVRQIGDKISVDELIFIFGNINNYITIPHCEKKPSISGEPLERIRKYVTAGEVDSAKKFIRAIKDEKKFSPVLFSDLRIRGDKYVVPVRQTFVDCGEITFDALKACLQDKGKVSLSEKDGNSLWSIFPDGQKISTGLNILLGARSSGKTHTLDRISQAIENSHYIKQFSLVQLDEANYQKDFDKDIQKSRSIFVDDYLSGFKSVLDQVINVDLNANERSVGDYVDTLLRSAEERDRQDAFSNTSLFSETDFAVSESLTLAELIRAIEQIIENIEFKDIIQKHVSIEALKYMILELIGIFRAKAFENTKKRFVNDLVKDVKQQLKVRTSATHIEDVDLYAVTMDRKRVRKFEDIVNLLKKEDIISRKAIQGFTVEARKMAFTRAQDVKDASGTKAAFSDALKKYDEPYRYLQALRDIDAVSKSDLFRLFVKIEYRILNKDGFLVSGGERSEFRLLQEIWDAQNYDVLLIDEPESSFDNLFLKSDVNKLLKDISKTMPVVVVTHNNTVGASIGADYVLFAKKEFEDSKIVYRLYSGHPADKVLLSVDGRSIANHEVTMNSLEAGHEAYQGRKERYENIKD